MDRHICLSDSMALYMSDSQTGNLVNVCVEQVKADHLVTRGSKGFSKARIPSGIASDFAEFGFEKTRVRYAIER